MSQGNDILNELSGGNIKTAVIAPSSKKRGRPKGSVKSKQKDTGQRTFIPGASNVFIGPSFSQQERIVDEPKRKNDVSVIELCKSDYNSSSAMLNNLIQKPIEIKTASNSNPGAYMKKLANNPEIINAGKIDQQHSPEKEKETWNRLSDELQSILDEPLPSLVEEHQTEKHLQENQNEDTLKPSDDKMVIKEDIHNEVITIRKEKSEISSNKKKGRRSNDYIEVSKYLTDVYYARRKHMETIIQDLAKCVFSNMLFHTSNKFEFVDPSILSGDDNHMVLCLWLGADETKTWGPENSCEFMGFDFIKNLYKDHEYRDLFRESIALYCGMQSGEWMECTAIDIKSYDENATKTIYPENEGVFIYIKMDKRKD